MSSKNYILDVFLLVNDINDLARARAAPNPLISLGEMTELERVKGIEPLS
jgi:hypothetical protein